MKHFHPSPTMPKRQVFLIVVGLLLSYLYVLPRWADWSQNSRLDLVRALSEQGSVIIDDYVANTGDYALFEGHAYSDKAPGPAFMALPAALLVQPMLNLPPIARSLDRLAGGGALGATLNPNGTGVNTDKVRAFAVLVVAAALAAALPAALGALALIALLRHLRVAAHPAIVV